MSKKKNQKVQVLPRRPGDVDSIILWGFETRVQLIAEIALGTQNTGTGKSGKEEKMPEFLRLVGSDWKADKDAIVDYMRAEVWEWWQSFPQRDLLNLLYRRDAKHREESGPSDGRRRPTHSEGLQVARPMLADIQNTGHLDSEWESRSVSLTLALLLMSPIGVCDMDTLQEYIERSEESRAYFDALVSFCEELVSRGDAIPRPAARWQQSVAGGRRQRPAKKPRKAHRPTNPAFLLRDIQVRFVIRILGDVGVKPRGEEVSGCRIVSEATGIPEETVIKIWKGRNESFSSQMRKHWKAIYERNGPFHPTKN